jgi:hypothetical protein
VKLATSLLLMIVARLLMLTFGTFSFIYTHIKFIARSIRLKSWKHLSNKLRYYYYELAWADDQKGNVLCQDVFNDWFIKRDSAKRYNYGKIDHTVSHVTGVNEKRGNLTFWGRLLVAILNLIDPGHTTDAADAEQFND